MRAGRAVLAIAGSDSSCGAGVQADLATIAAHGLRGVCAVTAVTAQDVSGVRAVHIVPARAVDAQVQSALVASPVRAVKTGMLATAETVEVVMHHAVSGALPNLVVDPVLAASSHSSLLDDDARPLLLALFAYATIVTPNIPEARALLGREIHTASDMREAGRELRARGARCAVVKGGHLGQGADVDVVDVVVDEMGCTELRAARAAADVHGSGCRFASALASRLALGDEPRLAAARAKRYVHAWLVAASS